MLIGRVASTDHSWHKEWTAPRVSPNFDLTLDDKSVLKAIEQLNFIQMKREYTSGFDTIISIQIPFVASLRNNQIYVGTLSLKSFIQDPRDKMNIQITNS